MKFFKKYTIEVCVLSVFLFFTSCSSDDNVEEDVGGEQGGDTTPIDPKKVAAIALYNDFYLASSQTAQDSQWIDGDPSTCNAGSVKKSTRDKIMMRLQYYRRATGLTNVITENMSKSAKAQEAALMMKVNGALSHSPPKDWICYTENGKEAAGKSNLTTGSGVRAIDSYIKDAGSNNFAAGHRRWLLWPKLQEVGIGNTDRSNVIWVIGNAGNVPEDNPNFIAWPPQGFVPGRLVYRRWSFSIAGADFKNASIQMKDSNGADISLSIEDVKNSFGDNTIVWIPEGIQSNISSDAFYKVILKNVIINNTPKDFEYEVILFNPDN